MKKHQTPIGPLERILHYVLIAFIAFMIGVQVEKKMGRDRKEKELSNLFTMHMTCVLFLLDYKDASVEHAGASTEQTKQAAAWYLNGFHQTHMRLVRMFREGGLK